MALSKDLGFIVCNVALSKDLGFIVCNVASLHYIFFNLIYKLDLVFCTWYVANYIGVLFFLNFIY